MKNAQKPDRFSLDSLLDLIKKGKFVIPDFQREFEWNPWDVRDLMKSIFSDYYVGTLLLWKGKEQNYKDLSCETVYGFEGDIERREYIVLDGQQRLTAIHYACFAPSIHFPKRVSRAFFYLDIDKFMGGNLDDAFHYDWISKGWERILNNPSELFERHCFPMHVLGKGAWDIIPWIEGYSRHWQEKADSLRQSGEDQQAEEAQRFVEIGRGFGNEVRELLRDYQISYIELDKDIKVDKVCDIFTQINSKGIQLDIFDLLNALLKPKGVQLKHKWREAAPRLEFLQSDRANVYVLQVMSILKQGYCSPKYLYYLLPGQPRVFRAEDGSKRSEILIGSGNEFEQSWHQALDAIESSIKVIQNPRDYGAISSSYIPYPSIVPALSAIRQHVKDSPELSGADAISKIRKWYWASIFTNRYSSSAESTSRKDFLELQAWFRDDEKEPASFREFQDRFQSMGLKDEMQKSSAIYKAIFNLLVIRGAKDWRTFELPEYDDLDDHHIVPSSWGIREKVDRINSILNRTPLSPETNRHVIQDKLPNQYLPELFEQHGEEETKTMFESHLISRAAIDVLLRHEFGPNDYEEFIDLRQKTILQEIEYLLFKDAISLPVDLRDIDEKIEGIELAIRELIVRKLGNDTSVIPEHLRPKVEGRIQTELKKRPGLDSQSFGSLGRKLQFFDMRECEQLIAGKKYWPEFADVFGNKEQLSMRFNQLADLRNKIRHSRDVDEITKLDGQAGISWFQQVLKHG